MNLKIVKVVLVSVCLSLLLSLVGCGEGVEDLNSHSETNQIAKLTQEERKEYVKQFLYKKYGIEAVISDVKKRQINAFSSEENYFAIATCSDGTWIDCWVSENGQVWDSKFINDLQSSINEVFANLLSDQLENYQVYCGCTLNSPTNNTWSEDMVEQMLLAEDISVSVRIFVDLKEKDKVIRLAESSFEDMFTFASGNGYIFFVDSIEDLALDEMDLTKYDISFSLKKG